MNGIILLIVLISSTVLFTGGCSESSSESTAIPGNEAVVINYLSEQVPGSANHSPDGTWWGYNQTKIARYGDRVFIYVVENNNVPDTASDFRIYAKQGDGAWTAGASFPTSRPGNILVDSDGGLHALVFEPTSILTNDSIGKLKHYTFPDSATGDISNYVDELVIDNDGSTETVNIRVGGAIGLNGTFAFGFGINQHDSLAQTERLYTMVRGDTLWTNLLAGSNLDHDFYYPFVLVTDFGYSLLPVQDDFNGAGNPNTYQIIEYFEYQGSWSRETIVDYSTHALSASRLRLLEQSDLFEASDGQIHLVYKEFLGENAGDVSTIQHQSGRLGGWTKQVLDFGGTSINWVRVIEIDSVIYFVCTSSNALYLMKAGGVLTKVADFNDMSGIYPYISSPRSGTRSSEAYLDILLLEGSSTSYPNASNYYVRIFRTEFSKLM